MSEEVNYEFKAAPKNYWFKAVLHVGIHIRVKFPLQLNLVSMKSYHLEDMFPTMLKRGL